MLKIEPAIPKERVVEVCKKMKEAGVIDSYNVNITRDGYSIYMDFGFDKRMYIDKDDEDDYMSIVPDRKWTKWAANLLMKTVKDVIE